jgi:hypothetical protein
VRYRIVLSLFLLPASLTAQIPFPLQRLDDIGELGMGGDDTEIDLGLAQAAWSESEGLRLEGRDDSSRPWTLRLEDFGRVFSPIFRGDLDANGRDDLLIVRGFVGNGRCIDRGEIVSLMFDELGRPTPWRASSNGIIGQSETPVSVLDMDADGRAEILLTACEYADPMTERRWIKGIYEAEKTRWNPFVPPLLEVYQEAATAHLGDWGVPNWTPVESTAWPDLQAGLSAPMELTLDAVDGAEFGCDPHGFHRKDRPDDEPPCTEGDSRGSMRFSAGSIRRGAPDVVFESRDNLDIRFDRSVQMLDLLASGSRFRAVGAAEEPALLWVDGNADGPKSNIAAQLRVTYVQTIPIRHEDKPVDETKGGLVFSTILSPAKRVSGPRESSKSDFAAHLRGVSAREPLVLTPTDNPPPPGRYFSWNGQCFRFQGYDPKDLAWFKPLANCAEIIPESAGLAASEAFLYQGPMTRFTVFSPSTRTLTTGPEPMRAIRLSSEPSQVIFEEPAGRPGEMVAVVESGQNGYVAQWRLGASNWLASYDRDGKLISPPIDLDFEGELFHVDYNTGYVFLVWEDGLPVEARIVRGRFEWTRAR